LAIGIPFDSQNPVGTKTFQKDPWFLFNQIGDAFYFLQNHIAADKPGAPEAGFRLKGKISDFPSHFHPS